MNFRIEQEKLEHQYLCSNASFADCSKGRITFEQECDIRTCYQRDTDRIIHSKAFRRLKHKTQVFLQPEGDHYRTRLTHTLEVSRIARTISRALRLNEDLTEAIALGHDLGHTPFGHAGERALAVIMDSYGGFTHYEQSLRVIDYLEKDGKGLNLTYEVRDGILRHTVNPMASTLEGRIVKLSDRIAYINHDVDDAVRAGIMKEDDIPDEITCAIGSRYSERINSIITNVIMNSLNKDDIMLSPDYSFILESFHNFMYSAVYRNEKAKGEEKKVLGLLEGLFNYYNNNPHCLPDDYLGLIDIFGKERVICDYISGMTDKYCIDKYNEIYIPAQWQVR